MTSQTTALRKLLTDAKALVDAVSYDDNGTMVGGVLVGGNGGLLSSDTIKAADTLRKELEPWLRKA